jgi:hypothetical protein
VLSNPCTYQVKTRFQNLPFKCNLCRCEAGCGKELTVRVEHENDGAGPAVGLCTLNQVDP